ncbi:hypothetical protein M430DRAFT_61324 [Amorphotheca resinae ATCC 22711]|uniref:F-box domain-containing protein n=1 Tax=Amorphotheca resinae ATCC 22711 TaxID=857342 RepID=A0A2T3ATY3_AMORE|nr:hypothetical protein M430DRAFT_61324 [Amorphotheca resinae ATCC 22711]PSS10958.1 hypothetical protein M430DRAFT_61324 [Amorphotheca resinae ATCC 22711]
MDVQRVSQELILNIIYFCDLPTIKHLRLANRSIRDLIDTYQISICGVITKRLFDEKEIESFRLLDANVPAYQSLLALDYRVRTAKWLTGVALENFQEDPIPTGFGNVEAGDPRGDPLREYVNTGWMVLWRLSDIARRVVCEMIGKNKTNFNHPISSWTRGSPLVRKLEASVQKQQLEYVNSLSFFEAFAYHMMHVYVSGAFHDRVFDDPRGRNSDWRTGNEFGINNSWLNWLVFREGPSFFRRAWATREGNAECLKLIITEWSKRSKQQVLIEHAAAKEVEERLLQVGKVLENGDLFLLKVGIKQVEFLGGIINRLQRMKVVNLKQVGIQMFLASQIVLIQLQTLPGPSTIFFILKARTFNLFYTLLIMVTAIKAMPNPVSHTMTHTITTKKLVIPTATAAQEPAKEPVSQKKSLSIGTDTHSYAEPTVSVETVYLRPENQFLTTMPADTRPVIMATPTGTA